MCGHKHARGSDATNQEIAWARPRNLHNCFDSITSNWRWKVKKNVKLAGSVIGDQVIRVEVCETLTHLIQYSQTQVQSTGAIERTITISEQIKMIYTYKRIPTLMLAVILTGCGLGANDNFFLPRPTDNIHPVVWGRAYRSAQIDATTLGLLVDLLGIKTVINLRGENLGEPWYDNEKALLEAKEVVSVDVRMSSKTLPAREELLKLYDTFLAAEEPILLHCKAGADRTGAAAAIWRMVVLGQPRERAAMELTLLYGHFEPATPAMDELIRIFEPDRAWIEEEYAAP